MSDVAFEPMTPQSDFADYELRATAEMTSDHLVSGAELKDMLARGAARAWWVRSADEQRLLGWCSLMEPPPFDAPPGTSHVLGVIVFGEGKGRGTGRKILDRLVALAGDRPMTAAIAPANLASGKLFRSAGFDDALGPDAGPWRLWRREAGR